METQKIKFTRSILEQIAREEHLDISVLEKGVKDGSIVILKNHDGTRYMGLGDNGNEGESLTTKVNVNVGLSADAYEMDRVLQSIGRSMILDHKRMTFMDLSSYPIDGKTDFSTSRRKIMELTNAPLGTSPLYEAVYLQRLRSGNPRDVTLDINQILEVTEKQAEEGIAFMIAYAGMNKKTHEILMRNPRPIVSKGGGITNAYIATTGKENPVLEHFDDYLAIFRKHDVVMNIGSALRSGSTIYNDEAQLAELKFVADLANYANERGVQVVIEGPGHVPLNEIQTLVETKKRHCGNRPYFTLGPLPTDNVRGSDGVAGSMGGAIGVMYGLSWLCAFTDKEHICMPTVDDVVEGVRYFVTAAKVGDLAKGQPREVLENSEKAQKGCLDINDPRKQNYCSICSKDYCPIELNPDLQPTFFGDK